jgi:hypothetical protein
LAHEWFTHLARPGEGCFQIREQCFQFLRLQDGRLNLMDRWSGGNKRRIVLNQVFDFGATSAVALDDRKGVVEAGGVSPIGAILCHRTSVSEGGSQAVRRNITLT